MEDQIGLANRLQELLEVIPCSSDEVRLERAGAVRAKVIARIDATPLETAGGLGEPGQLHDKELTQHDPGPEIAHEGTDRRQAGFRPCLKR
jgi:hypothetical protein